MAVTLLASACPLPTAPSTFIDPSTATPTVSLALAAGDTSRLLTVINSNAARADAHGRSGGGCYAITFGLGISAASGLNLTVAAGSAAIDGPVTVATNQTVVLPDNTARVYVWLSQLGVLSTVSNSTTAPAASSIFLGSAVTSGAAITSTDTSGVMRLCAGTASRATADTGCPSDSPNSNLCFLTFGSGGTWLWTGSAYVCLQGGRSAMTYASDADHTLTNSEREVNFLDYTASGTTLTATRKAILPLQAGRAFYVRNQSPGAQSIQFIGASGSGVTIANAATVSRIICDGTSWLAA